ncbi:RNA polymerase II subunit A C-terminal domain phosphatase-like [Lytechinus pictus]|uniref:RNA polymerase II subunit A C-terminal domain phosphatase-like n=1 Tax=Lytechinus pictus TaxID=7653 RepID=UPI0030B9D20F
MAASAPLEIFLPERKSCKISKLKVKSGSKVSKGTVLLFYRSENEDIGGEEKGPEQKLKSQDVGTVKDILANEGDEVKPGSVVLRIARCSHPTVMKDMCAECGEDLRKDDDDKQTPASKASVAMIHSIPELHVSKEEADVLAKIDEDSLIKHKKLVLLVDLDQTLIHTTLDDVPAEMPGVHHFQLRKGPMFPWYHTRIRDNYQQFLDIISQFYQLHIFTMGVRLYAHTIAEIIDPDGKFFSHRILSRDECFDPNSKKANLRSIFPRGDKMVCIIDDRDDVWSFAPNLIQVPPYRFFEGTGDINSPLNLNDRNNAPVKRPRESQHKSSPPSQKGDGDDGLRDTESKEGKGEVSKEAGEEEKTMDKNKVVDEKSEVCSSEVSSTTKDSEEESSDKVDKGRGKGAGEGDMKGLSKDEMEEGELAHEKESDSDKVTTTDGTGTEATSPVEDQDEYLLYLADTLTRIHRKFFAQVDANPRELPDLKSIVPAMRMSVLKGCNIVFSSVFPTNMPPEQSRVWKVALALGAKVSPQIVTKSKEEQAKGRATTHLVAAKVGTSKVHAAKRSKSILIVEPDWLWCCWERWERVDERLFLLADASKHGSRSSTPGFSDTESNGSQKGKGKAKVNTNGKAGSTGIPGQRTKSRPLSMSEDYNPMFSFSSEDLASMDKEVEDMFGSSSGESSSSSSSESEDDDRSNPTSLGSLTRPASSSSDESLTAENPRGWKRKREEMEDNDDDVNDFDPFANRPAEDSSSSAGLSEGEEWFSEEEGQKMANAIDDLLTYKRSVRKWDEG